MQFRMGVCVMIYSAAFVLLIAGQKQGIESQPITSELMNELWNSRRAIHSISLTVKARTVDDRGGRSETDYSIWTTKNRHRIDKISREGDYVTRTVLCRNCLNLDGHIFCWDQYQDASGKPRDSAQFRPNNKSDYRDHFFDPRMIGTIPTYISLLQHFHLEAEAGGAERGPFSIRSDTIDGTPARVVEFFYTTKSKPKMEYWIVPSRSNAVARITCTNTFKDNDVFVETIANETVLHQPPSIWFPVKCQYQRISNGTHRCGEDLDIQIHSLNEAIPDGVFSVAGMNFPEGRPIHAQDKTYVVKDGKLTERPARADNRPVLPTQRFDPQPASQRSYLIYGLIGFAFAAVLSLVFYFRSRSRAAS